jgi:hypothetical protein
MVRVVVLACSGTGDNRKAVVELLLDILVLVVFDREGSPWSL